MQVTPCGAHCISSLQQTEGFFFVSLQLDQVGHDFFVFQEKTSQQVQVLYRRKEEGYGVIVPHVLPEPTGT